jgi:hypothetical protein
MQSFMPWGRLRPIWNNIWPRQFALSSLPTCLKNETLARSKDYASAVSESLVFKHAFVLQQVKGNECGEALEARLC